MAENPADEIGVLGVLAFLVELAMVGLLAASCWRLGSSALASVLLAVALVGVVVAIWGRWMAPRSTHRLEGDPRVVAATALFVATGVLGVVAGLSPWILLAFVVIGSATFIATRRS